MGSLGETKMTYRVKILFGIIFLLAALSLVIFKRNSSGLGRAVKIGYFHGGRTMLLYRAYINGEFNSAKVPVEFFTRDLRSQALYLVSDKPGEPVDKDVFGKIRGGELIDEVVSGELDAATVGEDAFIDAVSGGKQIVAVAMLGHDTKEAPAHAILIRKGLKINSPQDLKEKVLATRRAGDGDATLLKEFLLQNGLDPAKDVKIIEQVDDTLWKQGLIDGTFDGGYYHEAAAKSLVESGAAYIYRKLDWVDPEISQSLLVFDKNFVEKHPDAVTQILRVYLNRIKYEKSLSEEVRMQYSFGMQMEDDFQGMNLPQYNFPPLVSLQLLDKMQDLLIKQKAINNRANLSTFIDNNFVETLAKGNN